MRLNYNCQVPLNPRGLLNLYSSNMTIGARVRQLRQQHKLSQEKFGELCGVTKGMVSQWESDIVTPPIDRLVELNRQLDFSFDWILKGKISVGAEIERHLSVQQKQAWYRVGRALAEPEEGTNGKQ